MWKSDQGSEFCRVTFRRRRGLRLPVLPAGEVWQRVQDTLVGAAADPRDGRRERAQDPHGRAPPGEHRVAAQHAHAAGPQHRGQLHRRHPPQQAQGVLQDLQPRGAGELPAEDPAGDPGHAARLEQPPRGHQRVPGGPEAHLPHGHPRPAGLQHPRGGPRPPLRGLPAVRGERLLPARRPALQRLPAGHPGTPDPPEGPGKGDPGEAAVHAGQGLLGRAGHPHREQQGAREGDDHAGAEGWDPGADLRRLRHHGQRQHVAHHAAAEAPSRAGEAAGGAAGTWHPAQRRLPLRGHAAPGHPQRPALPGLRHQGGHAPLHAHLRRLPHRAADLRARRFPDPQRVERHVQHPGHSRHGARVQRRERVRPGPLRPGAERGQGRPLPLPPVRRRRADLPGQAPGQAVPEGAGGGAGQHQPLRAGHADLPPHHPGPRPAPRGRPQRQVLWPGLEPEQDPARDGGHAQRHGLGGGLAHTPASARPGPGAGGPGRGYKPVCGRGLPPGVGGRGAAPVPGPPGFSPWQALPKAKRALSFGGMGPPSWLLLLPVSLQFPPAWLLGWGLAGGSACPLQC
ncbi:collagen alpha-1(X) chain isoform X2 [Pipistrellus kuhlii]|uniref:collagen alpha-1(X) chain isoform X2 n=1 Tax=Pipistrellus kuhlii TaxID=59472 RepID=UPI001E274454|nr:collagen alpha-1(X) chain isoform X2 [Pipistrellus kuhlii]